MQISKDIKDRLVDALITAFVFAAALAWQDTLVKVMQAILPDDTNEVWSELIVAGGITAIVIVLVYTLIKSNRIVDHRLGLDQIDSEEEQKNTDHRDTGKK